MNKCVCQVAAGANINIDRMPVDISSNTTRNLADLSHEAPELLALCTDLKSSLSEVRQRIGPLVQEVDSVDPQARLSFTFYQHVFSFLSVHFQKALVLG